MSVELSIADPFTLRLAEIASSLAETRDVAKVKLMRDEAQSVQALLKQQGYLLEAQNHAAEIKLRCERRLGELLTEMPPRPRFHDGTLAPGAILPEGVDKKQSHRWQRIAAIPPKAFESHIAETKEAEKELTSVGVLKLAKELQQPGKNPSPPLEGGCKFDDLHWLIGEVQAGRVEPFGCLYADPPWQYGNQSTRAATDNYYQTMTLDDICALPVRELLTERCHLHLWTTNGFLPDSFRVMESWGFVYKSVFVWCKRQMGIGNYWRVSHEFLLLGVKGSLPFMDKGLMSWESLSRGKHSSKPSEVRGMIERASPGPRLELFGRREAPGWWVWGNEVNGQEFRQGAFA